jgi:cell division inhibitor SepF
MGALRKAGVWLGLVEDEEDRDDGLFDDEFGEDDDFAAVPRPRSLVRSAPPRVPERREEPRDSRVERELRELRAHRDHAAERAAAERAAVERAAVERAASERAATERAAVDRERATLRGSELPDPRLPEARASVRHLGRPSGTSTGSTALSFPTQDNLALAPQVQLRERAVISNDDNSRRHEITTLHPTSYSEARAIGERFRDGHPVIMNLTEMDEPDAKRLVDFAAGLAFGLRGGMERVTNRVFLLSPPNIQVSAEDKARIAEGGFFDRG